MIFAFLTSCKQLNTTNVEYKNKFDFYSNKGFTIIYSKHLLKNNLDSNKIDERSLIIFSDKLNVDTPVKITNLLNGKYLVAKIGRNNKFPLFYNSVISKRISKELEINENEPYVKIQSINSESSFVANKAITFDEEKNVASKAPIEEITIKNLSNTKEPKVLSEKNNKTSLGINIKEFKYIIKFADLYFENSAINFKNRLTNEYKLNNVNINKLSKNLFRVYMGPYNSLNSIKKAFIKINTLDFDNIEIIKL